MMVPRYTAALAVARSHGASDEEAAAFAAACRATPLSPSSIDLCAIWDKSRRFTAMRLASPELRELAGVLADGFSSLCAQGPKAAYRIRRRQFPELVELGIDYCRESARRQGLVRVRLEVGEEG